MNSTPKYSEKKSNFIVEWKLQRNGKEKENKQDKNIKFIIETGIKKPKKNLKHHQTKENNGKIEDKKEKSSSRDDEIARKLRERISIKNLIHCSQY